jgi:hypothetical protein
MRLWLLFVIPALALANYPSQVSKLLDVSVISLSAFALLFILVFACIACFLLSKSAFEYDGWFLVSRLIGSVICMIVGQWSVYQILICIYG